MRQQFIFSTGREIAYDPINPRVVAIFEAQRRRDAPKPPMEVIEADGPLKGQEQENTADPEYQEALTQYLSESEDKRTEFYMLRARFEPLTEGWQGEVTQYRADMALLGVELPEDRDVILWLTDLACGDPEELADFMREVNNSHTPSAERRAAMRDSFRSNLQKS
jgi:hypothetical protein